jgi:hypothetical protein
MITTDDLTLRQLEARCRAHHTTVVFKRYGSHMIIIREVPYA